MKVALLINDKESREELARNIEAKGGTADEYGTAAKATDMFGATHYDLIVIHWQVRPGLKPSDPSIKELAAMIPVVSMNRNILYWETALRVIDIIRIENSPNKATPLVVIFPDLGKYHFEAGDRLSRESVDSDLASRQPAKVISDLLRDNIIDTIAGHHEHPADIEQIEADETAEQERKTNKMWWEFWK